MKWIIFLVIIIVLLLVDLLVINKKDHAFSFKEAAWWSVVWIGISCLFGGWMYWEYGHDVGNLWFTAYVLEKSLSVDNLFVMYLIFGYFATPDKYQHVCLFWGIIGAIVLRAIFIIGGATLISLFHPLLYVFAVILIISAIKLLLSSGDDEQTIHENKVVKFFKKHFNVIAGYEGHKFFVKKDYDHNGKFKWYATALFITLLMIETTDVVFATDSIPAAFGVTTNTFILYTSNIFAVLGLRALYFVLASAVEKLWALKYGITIVLLFIGVKMLLPAVHYINSAWHFEIPTVISLLVILGLILGSIIISFVKPRNFNTVYDSDPMLEDNRRHLQKD